MKAQSRCDIAFCGILVTEICYVYHDSTHTGHPFFGRPWAQKSLVLLYNAHNVLRNYRLTFLHFVRRHVFVLGKSKFADWCTAFMRGLDFEFFIKFERIGCIRVATMVIVSNNHSLRSLTCLNQWNASSHGQSKLIDLLFSNHPHNRH